MFGHIHEGAGTHAEGGVLFANASICTLAYEPKNPILVVDVPLDRAGPATLV